MMNEMTDFLKEMTGNKDFFLAMSDIAATCSRRLFLKLQDEGFTEEQAFELTKAYMQKKN